MLFTYTLNKYLFLGWHIFFPINRPLYGPSGINVRRIFRSDCRDLVLRSVKVIEKYHKYERKRTFMVFENLLGVCDPNHAHVCLDILSSRL